MLKVLILLYPRGDESKATTIGEMEIANVGGTVSIGEYAVRLFKRGSKAVWKRGSVVAFPRLSRGPYDLVFRALANIVAGRNKVVNYPKVWELEEESMANVEAMAAMAQEVSGLPLDLANAIRERVARIPAEGGNVYFVTNEHQESVDYAVSCAARSLILDLASERDFTVAIDRQGCNHAENFTLRPAR